MSGIVISDASRQLRLGPAVDHVDLTVEEGEFFTLLGPSGCGKTTLLRMIAGFCELDSGEIRFGEQAHRPACRRMCATSAWCSRTTRCSPTSPSPATSPTASRRASVPADETARRVEEALALVQLAGYGERKPHQLSGGQLQRVAIARALVIRPQVLLFDEPLSNLDARLRVSMRGEIRALQKSLGITAIYVTHDQEEAMSVSDRIALMNAGKLEQVGVPVDIYRQPASRFAAEFMGTTNLLQGAAARPRRAGLGVAAARGAALRRRGAGRLAAARRRRSRGSRCWGRSAASTSRSPTARCSGWRPSMRRIASSPVGDAVIAGLRARRA